MESIKTVTEKSLVMSMVTVMVLVEAARLYRRRWIVLHLDLTLPIPIAMILMVQSPHFKRIMQIMTEIRLEIQMILFLSVA